MAQTYWIIIQSSRNTGVFEKEIANIPNFCVLPFTSLNVDPDGTVGQCCEQNRQVLGLNINNFTDLQTLYQQPKLEFVRKAMLNNQRHISCNRCWQIEDAGGESQRQRTNKHYTNIEKDIPKPTQTDIPSIWDIRSSNRCNLKCRMCYPGASDKIAEEQFVPKALLSWSHDIILPHIDKVKEIKLLGGEPTLDVKNYSLLRALADAGRTDILLEITTNATTAKGDFFDMLKKFNNVNITFSIDSVGATNDYIRTNSKYETLLRNIETYRKQQNNWGFEISQTVSIYNLHDYYKLWTELDIPVVTNMVFMPDYLSIANLPDEIKQKYTGPHNDQNVNEILQTHVNPQKCFATMYNFLTYTNKLDIIRGTQYADINPELWQDIKTWVNQNWSKYSTDIKQKVWP